MKLALLKIILKMIKVIDGFGWFFATFSVILEFLEIIISQGLS